MSTGCWVQVNPKILQQLDALSLEVLHLALGSRHSAAAAQVSLEGVAQDCDQVQVAKPVHAVQ